MSTKEAVLHLVKTDEPDDVTRITQALYDLIESLDIDVLIENEETPRGYIIDPAKGILRGNAATHDAVIQLGISLLGRLLFDRGGAELMHRVRDQVAQQVADALRGSDGDTNGKVHRRWLAYLFKVGWKGIDA